MCAVIYEKYPHFNLPNPQAMCSNMLEPGACSGSLNNATRFIACCEVHMCNDHNFVMPVYADPTTTTEASTPTTAMSDQTHPEMASGGPRTGVCVYATTPCAKSVCMEGRRKRGEGGGVVGEKIDDYLCDDVRGS